MKNFIKALLLSLVIAAAAVTSGCASSGGGNAAVTTTAVTTPAATAAADNTEKPSDETKNPDGTETEAPPKEDGLWTNAKYTEDKEIGEGAVTVKVKVQAGEKAVTLTVHTDKDNLGAALLEYELVSGDNGQYGLYIKSVNGIEADYDKDKAWWSISKDGESLMTGADSTPIADGENYELTYTKS